MASQTWSRCNKCRSDLGRDAPRGRRSISQALQMLWQTPVSPDAIPRLPSPPPQPFLTLNHAAYNAGKNSKVNTVATINPPMIATAIGP